jgi:hypothetical protein
LHGIVIFVRMQNYKQNNSIESCLGVPGEQALRGVFFCLVGKSGFGKTGVASPFSLFSRDNIVTEEKNHGVLFESLIQSKVVKRRRWKSETKNMFPLASGCSLSDLAYVDPIPRLLSPIPRLLSPIPL